MPASLYYPDPQPPANSTFFPTQMDSASSSSMMAGNNPTEQLALQLALLQGGLQPEWSTGDSSRLDDSRLYNGSSFRGSLEDLKMPPQRKSQNMTECVPVPTSEHVAEIVGRQGCKIKALRAKTNTYIKTPVRGEEPVFVVTGRKEDVALAKREILSAADHFSQIRASRKSNINSTLAFGQLVANQPGQTTQQVRVPYRVVGLVVGPKGATIKRIQQQTRTYIVTPSRDKEPVFEVTGLPENVEVARKEIEAHIAFRTGSSDAGSAEGSTSGMNGFYNNLNELNGDDNVFSNSSGSSVLGGGSADLGHVGRENGSIFSSTSAGNSAVNLDHLGNNLQQNGINNYQHENGSIFGSGSSRASAAAAAGPAVGGNRTDPLFDRKSITLQNILDGNNFDLISNSLAVTASGSGGGSSNSAVNSSSFFHDSGANGWGDSQDSGISNSPPFDKAVNSQQQAAVERSGSGIWGDLNKALGGMKISPPSPPSGAAGDPQTRASVDLGTLGRPAMIPLTSSNSLTLIGATEKDESITANHNTTSSTIGVPSTVSTINYHHQTVVATSSTGSSSVASLSEMSPPNSLPHFLSSEVDKADNNEEKSLKKLIMIRNEELLRQNEMNEKKSSFEA